MLKRLWEKSSAKNGEPVLTFCRINCLRLNQCGLTAISNITKIHLNSRWGGNHPARNWHHSGVCNTSQIGNTPKIPQGITMVVRVVKYTQQIPQGITMVGRVLVGLVSRGQKFLFAAVAAFILPDHHSWWPPPPLTRLLSPLGAKIS